MQSLVPQFNWHCHPSQGPCLPTPGGSSLPLSPSALHAPFRHELGQRPWFPSVPSCAWGRSGLLFRSFRDALRSASGVLDPFCGVFLGVLALAPFLGVLVLAIACHSFLTGDGECVSTTNSKPCFLLLVMEDAGVFFLLAEAGAFFLAEHLTGVFFPVEP